MKELETDPHSPTIRDSLPLLMPLQGGICGIRRLAKYPPLPAQPNGSNHPHDGVTAGTNVTHGNSVIKSLDSRTLFQGRVYSGDTPKRSCNSLSGLTAFLLPMLLFLCPNHIQHKPLPSKLHAGVKSAINPLFPACCLAR